MAFINKELDDDTETVCMMSSAKNIHISSSTVKQVARFGGDISGLVPNEIISDIMSRINL